MVLNLRSYPVAPYCRRRFLVRPRYTWRTARRRERAVLQLRGAASSGGGEAGRMWVLSVQRSTRLRFLEPPAIDQPPRAKASMARLSPVGSSRRSAPWGSCLRQTPRSSARIRYRIYICCVSESAATMAKGRKKARPFFSSFFFLR